VDESASLQVPGAGAIEISEKARPRRRWFDYYRAHGYQAALTCRYFGISRQTFYGWKQQLDYG
jgi:hypothetical protein